MKEKISIKSICLPKSYIFASGSGEKSISVSEGIATSRLETSAKEKDRRRKQTMLFSAVVFSQRLMPLFGYRREQVFLSNLSIREILGRKSAARLTSPSRRRKARTTLTLFSCLRPRMDREYKEYNNLKIRALCYTE